jgi:FXSXX-COOH protein
MNEEAVLEYGDGGLIDVTRLSLSDLAGIESSRLKLAMDRLASAEETPTAKFQSAF